MEPADPARVRHDAAAAAAAVFDRLLAAVDEDLRPRWSAGPTGGPDQDEDAVRLEAAAGCVAEGRIWLHNTSGTALVGVRLLVTDLLSRRGGRVAGSSAELRPDAVDVPANGTAPVTILLPVPHGSVPTVYAGRVVSRLPPAEVALRLAVRA